MRISPGTADMFKRFTGRDVLTGARLFFALDDDDEPIGVYGFIRRAKGQMYVLSLFSEALCRDKRSVVRFYRHMLSIADAQGWVLTAEAEKTLPTSVGFLEHIGFVRNEGSQDPAEEFIRCPSTGSPT